jgi:hypothetical protein
VRSEGPPDLFLAVGISPGRIVEIDPVVEGVQENALRVDEREPLQGMPPNPTTDAFMSVLPSVLFSICLPPLFFFAVTFDGGSIQGWAAAAQ